MVRLNVSLTFQIGSRLLFLAGFATASLQTAEIAGQENPPGRSRGENGSRNREDGDREENRQSFAENNRRRKLAFSTGIRRPDSNREGREPFQQFFQEGQFESQPTNEGFIIVNGEFSARPYTFRTFGKETFVNDVLIAGERAGASSSSNIDNAEGYARSYF